ncbi:MAG: hypothetical protein R2850_13495 [Bacteroidia bacterium]
MLVSLVLFASCTKTEEKIITGNEPPPDQTLPQGLRSSFVTKAYIGLLGREADQSEYDAAINELNTGNFSKSSRRSVITSILESDDFYSREFELGRINLLNGLDTLQVRDFINTFEYLLTLPAYEAQWPVIETELVKLYDLQSCVQDLRSGAIEFREMNRRCIDNNFYDQINMGSLNFVLACFQNLLLRNPTEFELEQGIRMVDGFNGVVFLEAGNSKREFEDLFIASRDYAEGQVKILFNRFLFRVPNSEEMTGLAEEYQQNNNYKNLITKILETDEYAGL